VIVGLVIPVALGMLVRRLSANAGAVLELVGGVFGVLFIPFLIAIWVPRNWQLLLSTEWPTYVVAIGLGIVGISIAYAIAKAIRLHPMNVRTIALETGIQNGPLGDRGDCCGLYRQPRTRPDPLDSSVVLAVYRDHLDACDLLVPPGKRCRGTEDS